MNSLRFTRVSRKDQFSKKAFEGENAYDVDSSNCYIFSNNTWMLLLTSNESTNGDAGRKHSTTCPRCGAPCSPYQEKCDYCDSYFEF